ncbi:MAG: hypothetical protein KKF65_00560, partial [Nanoarchaeota archaeon]|nr:hypothetical protein [Nanoarchaeota archaeon]
NYKKIINNKEEITNIIKQAGVKSILGSHKVRQIINQSKEQQQLELVIQQVQSSTDLYDQESQYKTMVYLKIGNDELFLEKQNAKQYHVINKESYETAKILYRQK